MAEQARAWWRHHERAADSVRSARATPTATAAIDDSTSVAGRTYLLMRAWEREHAWLKRSAPTSYTRERAQVSRALDRGVVGLPPRRAGPLDPLAETTLRLPELALAARRRLGDAAEPGR